VFTGTPIPNILLERSVRLLRPETSRCSSLTKEDERKNSSTSVARSFETLYVGPRVGRLCRSIVAMKYSSLVA
jgi:hypothetical protein